MRVRHQHFAGATGRWSLWLAEPPPDLAPFVEAFWEVRGRANYTRERILPAANIELMFNLGLPHRVVDRDDLDRATPYRRAWISALQERYLLIEPCFDPGRHDAHHSAIRLTPQGAYAVLAMPMNELANSVFELDQIVGTEVDQLGDTLLNLPSPESRFHALAAFARRRIACTPVRLRSEVEWALQRIRCAHGALPIEPLAKDLGISRKHLAALFDRSVGITPKRFARVLRFKHAIELLEAGRICTVSSLAHTCGYYDQSHFDREFHRFAGMAPRVYLEQRLPGGAATLDA